MQSAELTHTLNASLIEIEASILCGYICTFGSRGEDASCFVFNDTIFHTAFSMLWPKATFYERRMKLVKVDQRIGLINNKSICWIFFSVKYLPDN